MIGKRFLSKNSGEFVVLSVVNANKVLIEFTETGTKGYFKAANIRSGSVRDVNRPSVYGVGFIGLGSYRPSIDGVLTPQYSRWVKMMQRCYDNNHQKRNPSYIGCSVCKDWHNFQNFAKWFDENYPNDGGKYHLDKDIKISGNKVYSPSSCLFVDPTTNIRKSVAKRYELISPDGEFVEVENMREFCKANNLNTSGMSSLVNGKIKSSKGWRVKSVSLTADQLKEVK